MSKTTVTIAIIVILAVAGIAYYNKGKVQAPTDDTAATTTAQMATTTDAMTGTSTDTMTE